MKNFDYLSDVDFDLMTEDEFLNYLDEKAKWIRENHFIKPLSPYHIKLATEITTSYEKASNNL
jgi:hypothetical protein